MRVAPAERDALDGRRASEPAAADGVPAETAALAQPEQATPSAEERVGRAAGALGAVRAAAARRGQGDEAESADGETEAESPSTEAGGSGAADNGSRRRPASWRPMQWPVAVKVIAVLAIPAIVAAFFGFVQASTQFDAAAADARAERQTTALMPAWDMIIATDGLVLHGGDDAAAVAAYDEARANLQKVKETADLSVRQSAAVDAVLIFGADIRTRATQFAAPQVTRLALSVAELIGGFDATSLKARQGLDVMRELVSARVALTDQRVAVAHPSKRADEGRSALAAAIGAEAAAIGRIENPSSAVQPSVSALSNSVTQRLIRVRDGATVDPATMDAAVTSYDEAVNGAVADISKATKASADQARETALLSSALVVALLVAAILVAILLARSLTRPLAEVRRSTQDIADRRLPRDVAEVLSGDPMAPLEPITIRSTEEIGQLARAVESMYGRARSLASSQADLQRQVSGMFETLSRRSNALVDRQLAIMERLERDEDDPERLEQLFELDHLAARMRRNGDSLLVLAGAKGRPPRVAEIAIEDAVRAASSEVRDYRRLSVGGFGGARVVAAVSSDLIHLFAELIDNALAYSPPGTEVTAVGARTADGGMLVEIVDEGLGIGDAERTRLNELLQSSSSVSPEAARRMGLHVVARLAATHGITVMLRPGSHQGTVAAVSLPAALLAVGMRTSVPDADGPRMKPVQRQPSAPALGAMTDQSPVAASSASRQSPAREASDAQTRAPLPQRGDTSSAVPERATNDAAPVARTMDVGGGRPPLARRVRGESDFPGAAQPESTFAAAAMPAPSGGSDLAAPSRDGDGDGDGEGEAAPRQLFTGFLSRSAASARLDAERAAGGSDVDEESSTTRIVPIPEPENPISGPTPIVAADDAPVADGYLREWPDDESAETEAHESRTRSDQGSDDEADGEREAESVVTRENPTITPATLTQPSLSEADRAARSKEQLATAAVRAIVSSTRAANAARNAENNGPVMGRRGTPIFDSMSSRWLSEDEAEALPWSSDDVERARVAAERASSASVTAKTARGLPQRTPGAHLSPGGTELSGRRQANRDPQAVQDSLNRHIAAVRRGRSAARFPQNDSTRDDR